jgi:tRNA G18 (ribose-2'-O)-methylase SpoU
MRGYFAMGVEGTSKPKNLGNLLRSAHAFGASFFFTIAPAFKLKDARFSDTAKSPQHLPLYSYGTPADLVLPRACALVGVEFDENAVDLPSFHHPLAAAYILGPERGSLTPELTARCDHLVKIPTKFCINVGVAGAIVMYDRVLQLGRHARRPVGSLGLPDRLPEHVQGAQLFRSKRPLPVAEGPQGPVDGSS